MNTKIAVTIRSGNKDEELLVGLQHFVASKLDEIDAKIILEIGTHLVTSYLDWSGPIAMIQIEPQANHKKCVRIAVTQVIHLGWELKFK